MEFVFLTIFIIITGSAAYAGFSAAPWLPTRARELDTLLNKIALQNGQTIYDLGCGTGSMLFAVADKYPEAKLIGYEISILPYLVARAKQIPGKEKYKNVSVRFGNLYKQDLRDADVIFIFLLEKAYPKLIKKFAHELKDDCKVILEAWPMKDIVPQDAFREDKALPIYIYKGVQFKNL